ncbi:hypothetical protein RB195_011179 [Necator americanus]|uniref:EH domain-containing protein n=1 Tax=Necator americanus TaxID=51031 RepID=A0ABR1D345_NECAM
MNNSNTTTSPSYNQQSKIMEEVMMSGNIPIPAPGRTGMMGGGGGVVPPALLDESRVPRFYRDAIVACGATQVHMLPHTALVYNMMVTSGLPRPVLSYIWSAVNRTLPGQLTRPEFFSCLALIALAQKGESLAALSTMPSLPIPFLQSVQLPAAQPLSAPVVNVAKPSSAPTAKEQRHSSSFIPTSLLLGRRNNKKKEVDLIGEAIPPPPMSSPQSAPISPGESAAAQPTSTLGPPTNNPLLSNSSRPSALNDLCSIDWSSVAPTQATVPHEPSLSTTDSSKSEEDASTATHFSMSCSTASDINGTVISSVVSAELTECWKKIISAAVEIFEAANNLLGSATEPVLKEIAQTERGDGYLRCLNRLYFVVCRVERSAGVDLPQTCLDDIAKCGKIWKRLSCYIEGPHEEDDCGDKADKKCAICYQPVSNAVYFGGQTYHSECANLWHISIQSSLKPHPLTK